MIDNEYDLFAVLPATTNDTIGVPRLAFNETRTVLREFNELGYVFGVLFNVNEINNNLNNEINNAIELEFGMFIFIFIFPKIRFI